LNLKEALSYKKSLEPKHAAFPWHVSKTNAGTHVVSNGLLVVCHLKNCDKEHRENNAQLIASAPDMLIALQAIAGINPSDTSSMEYVVNLASDAVAKVGCVSPLLKFIDITEQPPTNTSLVIGMLKTAIKILENEDGARAAWRIADAGLMMRNILTNRKEKDICGFDEPTGMGAILPTSGA